MENHIAETRVVAFLDILGFEKLVDKHISDSDFLGRLDLALKFAKKVFIGRYVLNRNFTARMFSDCICASCPVTKGVDILNFVYALEALQLRLANSGIFIQGGVSIGLHYETPQMIFSNGLIHAYRLQKDHAIYPRILLSGEFLELLDDVLYPNIEEKASLDWKGVSQSREFHFSQGNDERFFLNYLTTVLYMKLVSPKHVLPFAYDHKTAIQNWAAQGRTEKESDKHDWVIEYHNKFFRKYIPSEQGLIISKDG